MTKQTKQQKIEEIVEVLLKYLPMPVKKRASKVKELAENIIWLLREHRYSMDGGVRVPNVKEDFENKLKILISESPAEIKFELDAEKLAAAIVEISQIILSDNGNGGEPPKDPPQYLFDLLKQETEQLWQRSIMLLTIFAGIFTAYGQIILPIFKEVTTIHTLTAQHHFFAALVALIGVIFSFLWIIIGKGAYYWYLKYYLVLENEYNKYNKKHKRKEISYFNLPSIGVEDCLLSTHPGRYSLSRSQISIGLVLLLIWSAVFTTHTVQFVVNSGLVWLQRLICWNQRWITLGGMVLAFGVIYIIYGQFLKSLKHEGKNDYSIETEEKIKKIVDSKERKNEKIKRIVKLMKFELISTLNEKLPKETDALINNGKASFLTDKELSGIAEYLYNKYCKK